jgi:hypothetical protein
MCFLKRQAKNVYPGRSALAQLAALVAIFAGFCSNGLAQNQTTAKAMAPVDLTGYWVTIISPDWRERMVTPAKGDYLGVPITAAAQKAADAWDPAKDEAAGEQCKSYGAPALMATPTRLHITWQDDNTLKVESDYGMQARLFHFGGVRSSAGPATWQGDSVAIWEMSRVGGPQGRGREATEAAKFGDLKITTTHVRPGYLRKNGVPYSANVRVTEYWDFFKDPDGVGRIMITQQIDDPEYLYRTWIATYNFKQELDAAKWNPTPCSSK